MPAVRHWCLMCGAPCDPSQCRYASVGDVHALVRPRCVRTGFHYAAVLAIPAAERRPLCLNCINWRRRDRRDRRFYGVASGLSRRATYTPLDSVIMYALQPGHTPEPDHRCLARLVGAAVDPCNAFAAVIPGPVRAILERAAGEPPESVAGAIVRAWWDLNEGTSFFRSPGTARASVEACIASTLACEPGHCAYLRTAHFQRFRAHALYRAAGGDLSVCTPDGLLLQFLSGVPYGGGGGIVTVRVCPPGYTFDDSWWQTCEAEGGGD